MRLSWFCFVFALLPAAVATTQSESAKDNGRIAATVLGQRIATGQSARLTGLILGRLLNRYADKRGIEVTDDEIEVFLLSMEARERRQLGEMKEQWSALREKLDAGGLDDHERGRVEARLDVVESILERFAGEPEYTDETKASIRTMKRESARHYIRQWKINQALYREYGGRVIFQQAGPEPIDAYRTFLKEHEKRGSFRILTEELEKEFWRYFIDDDMHNFYPEGEGEKFMETPWWELEEPDSG